MTSKTEKISPSKKHIYDDLFCPRNIAVAGASNTPGKMGNLFVQHLLDGYSGGLYLVHPTEKEIEGVAVYNDLAMIPEPVDLLIVLVPQKQMVSLLHSCLPGRVKFMLAIPSGFGEVSPQGKKYELELLQMTRERGIRIIGPRPERPEFIQHLEAKIPYYAIRHSVSPGITGWAQVNYHYGASVEDSLKKLEYDIYYIKNMSLFLDLKIVLKTIGVVLFGQGAR